MQFTGRNLALVWEALECLRFDTQNMIVTCPDPLEYALEVEAYKRKKREISGLLDRLNSRAHATLREQS